MMPEFNESQTTEIKEKTNIISCSNEDIKNNNCQKVKITINQLNDIKKNY